MKERPQFKPVVLVVLDGWGTRSEKKGNAIAAANPPNFKRFWAGFPHCVLETSGPSVGLPQGQAGNSEVGHLNLGAGKVVFQDALRIDMAIKDKSFFKNEAFCRAFEHIKKNNSKLHLVGLLSPGAVHATINHLLSFIDLAKLKKVPPGRLFLHLFTDGRDSPPTSASDYLAQIESKLKEIGIGQIATLTGRYYAMDRDGRWERTKLCYDAMTKGLGKKAGSATEAILLSYKNGKTDEYLTPTVVLDDDKNPVGKIENGDGVIFFNFRADRIRQLAGAFTVDDFANFRIKKDPHETPYSEKYSIYFRPRVISKKPFARGEKIKNLYVVTAIQYQKELPVSAIAYSQQEVALPLGRVIAENDLRQCHAAETEKYPHVTYFFNGRREPPFQSEDRILIPSPKVRTYDLKPEMSALEIAHEVISRIKTRSYDFLIVNLGNVDMVSHTGDFEATKKAVLAADFAMGEIVKTTLAYNGITIVTGDHGNAEEMLKLQGGDIDTEHNINPVPCIFIHEALRGRSSEFESGILADVAPTILSFLKIPRPSDMTGRELL